MLPTTKSVMVSSVLITAATRELLEKYGFYKRPEEEIKEEEK